jgi:hypothetical protein
MDFVDGNLECEILYRNFYTFIILFSALYEGSNFHFLGNKLTGVPSSPICNLTFKDLWHIIYMNFGLKHSHMHEPKTTNFDWYIFTSTRVSIYIMWVSLSLRRCRSTWVTKLMLIFCCSVLNSRLKQNHASCDHFYCLHLATFYLWRIFTNTFLGHQQPNVSIYKLNSTLYTLWGVEFLY